MPYLILSDPQHNSASRTMASNRSNLWNEKIAKAFEKAPHNQISIIRRGQLNNRLLPHGEHNNTRLLSHNSRRLLVAIDEAIPLRPPHAGSAPGNESTHKRKVCTNDDNRSPIGDFSSNAHAECEDVVDYIEPDYTENLEIIDDDFDDNHDSDRFSAQGSNDEETSSLHQTDYAASSMGTDRNCSDEMTLSSNEVDDLLKTIKAGLRRMATWDRLFSFLAINGTIRFNKVLYEMMRNAIHTCSDGARTLVCYKTIKAQQNEYFLSTCAPLSKIYFLQHNEKKLSNLSLSNNKSVMDCNGVTQQIANVVNIVLPSSYATFDLQNYVMYREIYHANHLSDNRLYSIERSNLCVNRQSSIGSCKSFWVQCDGLPHPLSVDDPVSFLCINPSDTLAVDQIWPTVNRSTRTGNLDQEQISIHGILGPQWCVTKTGYRSKRSTTISSDDLSVSEALIYNSLRSSSASNFYDSTDNVRVRCNASQANNLKKRKLTRSSRVDRRSSKTSKATSAYLSDYDPVDVIIYPSDICVFLRPTKSVNVSNLVCLFIASFVSGAKQQPAERLVWLISDNKTVSSNDHGQLTLKAIATANVKQISGRLKDRSELHNIEPSAPMGTLDDGTPYYVYRFGLFADEFKEKKSMKNTRNVCGIYMSVLGLSIQFRQTLAGCRVLSIVPYGLDPNLALNIIIDDVVRGATEGVEIVDLHGKKCLVFLDLVCFFGDFVKMAAVTDTCGHSSKSFCTYCGVQRAQNNGGTARYIYSSAITCRRLGYMRCDERIDIFRAMRLSDEELKLVGLKQIPSDSARLIPLRYFSDKLLENRSVIRQTSSGRHVVPSVFDSSLSTAVAPDHLITGLISSILQTCFNHVRTKDERLHIETRILSSAASNGLFSNGRFLYHEGSSFKGIKNNMTMSTLYIILLFSSRIFLEPRSFRFVDSM